MADSRLLRRIVRAVAAGDIPSLQAIAEDVILAERQKQHHMLANELQQLLLGGRAAKSQSNVSSVDLPHDKERGLALLETREVIRRLDDLILNEDLRHGLRSFVDEHMKEELLRSYGLTPSTKMLFYGPPGCGKTASAEAIAGELGLPLFVVRLDSVISSFLGETAANLRRVFDFLARYRCIALFDEFDGLAKERADESDHGELKRVVNAVLQMMDGYHGRSIIIAATNHEQILDTAIWRRFDEALLFPLPNTRQLRSLIERRIRSIPRSADLLPPKLPPVFSGMSFADAERVIVRATKEMILEGGSTLNRPHLEAALSNMRPRRGAPRSAKQ
jgi:SpoVK/Ycf46/Vps4 family AAA+-type ATPase